MSSYQIRRIALGALVTLGCVMLRERWAAALGCKVPPCGGLTNHSSVPINVKWTDDDGKHWQYRTVNPNHTIGGFFNDRIDVDYWFIPGGCVDRGKWSPVSHSGSPWSGGDKGRWAKIDWDETVVIESRICQGPPPPPSPPPQGPACQAPPSWPPTKSWVSIWGTATGHSGPDDGCPKAGSLFASTRPQYVWCRRWGGQVADSRGNSNQWWLWTDLDTGGRGWVSAYYVGGQGNDQADDLGNPPGSSPRRAVPTCPGAPSRPPSLGPR
jgi:hypothetical protein